MVSSASEDAAAERFGGLAVAKLGEDTDEELFDYGNNLGVAAGTIYGLKKTRFNNADFGTIVMSTWAARHS